MREVSFIDKILISQSASMNFQNHLHPWTNLMFETSFIKLSIIKVEPARLLLFMLIFRIKKKQSDLIYVSRNFDHNINWSFLVTYYFVNNIFKDSNYCLEPNHFL
jgi:hypothetical protein